MAKPKVYNYLRRSLVLYLSCTVLSALAFVVYCFLFGIAPFGQESLIFSQHSAALSSALVWFGEVLRGQGSLVFSFAKGLGEPTLPLVGLLLFSPFNIVAGFFDASQLVILITFLYGLKCTAASLSFCVYAHKRFSLSGPLALALSLVYGILGLQLAFVGHLEWLEVYILLPLIALGSYICLHQGRVLLLGLSLGFSCATSIELAPILLLFVPILFLFERFMLKSQGSVALENLSFYRRRFWLSVTLGLLAASLVYVPLAWWMLTHHIQDAGSFLFASQLDSGIQQDMLELVLLQAPLGLRSKNMIFFVPGLASILALSWFVFGPSSQRRLRLALGLVLALFVTLAAFPRFGLLFAPLIYSSDISGRYLVYLAFFLCLITALALQALRQTSDERLVKSLGIPAAAVVLTYTTIQIFDRSDALLHIMIQVSCNTLIFFSLMVLIALRRSIVSRYDLRSLRAWQTSLGAVLIVALSLQSYVFFYRDQSELRSVDARIFHEMTQGLQAEVKLDSNQAFARTKRGVSTDIAPAVELTWGAQNMILGQLALATSPALSYLEPNQLLARMGYGFSGMQAAWSSYPQPLLLSDSLLAVRSIINTRASQDTYQVASSAACKRNLQAFPKVSGKAPEAQSEASQADLEQAGSRRSDSADASQSSDASSSAPGQARSGLQKTTNDFAMGLAYMVSDGISPVQWSQNPFRNQELFLKEITGASFELYTSAKIEDARFPTVNTPELHEALATIGNIHRMEQRSLVITASETGPMYLRIQSAGPVAVVLNQEFLQLENSSLYDRGLIYLGSYKSGERVRIQLRAPEFSHLRQARLEAASLNLAHTQEILSQINDDSLRLRHVGQNRLKGGYVLDQEAKALVSLPFDRDIKVKVDGRRIDASNFEGLMLLNLPAGSHDLSIEYMPTTAPLALGLLVSLLSLGGLWLLSKYPREANQAEAPAFFAHSDTLVSGEAAPTPTRTGLNQAEIDELIAKGPRDGEDIQALKSKELKGQKSSFDVDAYLDEIGLD